MTTTTANQQAEVPAAEAVPAGEWTISFVGEARGPLLVALDGAVGCVVDAVATDGSVVTGRLTRVAATGVTLATGDVCTEEWDGPEVDVALEDLERLLVW